MRNSWWTWPSRPDLAPANMAPRRPTRPAHRTRAHTWPTPRTPHETRLRRPHSSAHSHTPIVRERRPDRWAPRPEAPHHNLNPSATPPALTTPPRPPTPGPRCANFRTNHVVCGKFSAAAYICVSLFHCSASGWWTRCVMRIFFLLSTLGVKDGGFCAIGVHMDVQGGLEEYVTKHIFHSRSFVTTAGYFWFLGTMGRSLKRLLRNVQKKIYKRKKLT